MGSAQLTFATFAFSNYTAIHQNSTPIQLSTGWIALLCVGVSTVLITLWKHLSTKSTLQQLDGPAAQSFLLGNQLEYEKTELGVKDLEWMNKYGKTFKFKGGWGEDVIYTSDPRALQFIMQVSAYNFQKTTADLERQKLMLGPGILGTEHDAHKRLRRAILPAFTLPETKALTSVFQEAAQSLVGVWTHMIEDRDDGSVTVNVHKWLARGTMDAIGEASFGTHFGTLSEEESPLANAFKNIILRTAGEPSLGRLIITNTLQVLPSWVVRFVISRLRTSSLKAARDNHAVASKVGGDLLIKKEEECKEGVEGKDLMSLLVKANHTEKPGARLNNQELLGQISAILLAGHETTATTATWALWALSKEPSIQDKLRAEINEFHQTAVEHGEESILVTEYEKMTYLQAFLKETLRFFPLVPLQHRAAVKDIIVPLSEPLKTKDGRVLKELPVKKGTRIEISIWQYNRHPELWGEDADSFKPERWLDKDWAGEATIKYGAFANLATFGAGVHVCIGWRFAVYELQSFLIELIRNFRFDCVAETERVKMRYVRVTYPLMEGNDNEAQMPLRISLLK